MSRVLTVTGETAGEGLLKRALELRDRISQQSDSGEPQFIATPQPAGGQSQPAGFDRSDIEKKKPSHQFFRKAA